MKTKGKAKENKILILLVIILIIIIFYNVFKVRSYTKKYKVNNYDILEKYDKKTESYTFVIEGNDTKYSYSVVNKYLRNKKLIKEISTFIKDDYKCIVPDIKGIDAIPLCSLNKELVDYRLTGIDFGIKEKNTSVELEKNNIKISNVLDNYLVWNYKSFYNIYDKKIEEIKLFKKDIYDIHLATVLNNYLVIPDYDSEYNFNTFYIYDLEKKSLSTWKTKYDISFDSYIAGSYDKSIYLVDKKNKIEYEIVPHKKKIRIVGSESKLGTIYQNGWKDISLTKLTSEEIYFQNDEIYKYSLDKSNLYLENLITKSKTLISEDVDKLLVMNSDSVYYLRDDNIYGYKINTGEKLIMSNFEWNFNNDNILFIY